MKVINCFVLSIFLFIAGCGNIEWFPGGNSGNQSLTKAFSTTSSRIGNSVTLTFTISNAAGNPVQSNLTFTDNLPTISKGNGTFPMFVANPSNATNTCGGAIYTGGTTNTISPGDQAITFSGGSIGAGPATCTVSVDVTNNASTDTGQPFTNGSANLSGNLNLNNLKAQSLAFTPFTKTISGVTLSARDLVVTTKTGTTQFSLYIDNSTSTSVSVTVTVTGYDSTAVLAYTAQVTADVLGGNGQHFTLSATNVPTTIKTWKITDIN